MTPHLINVRGCNGSGKTTLLRCLGREPGAVLRVLSYCDKDQIHTHYAGVTICPSGTILVGDYLPRLPGGNLPATAGLDRVSTQAGAKELIEKCAALPGAQMVLFEGVVVATIYGPWKDWAAAHGGMTWAFLDTPLEVCLKRIQERNGGKPVKEDQVADKHRTISRVREKALADGLWVADIRWDHALADLRHYIARPPEE